jgi:hypothetical protein
MLLILLTIRYARIIPDPFPDGIPILVVEGAGKLVRRHQERFEEFLFSASLQEDNIVVQEAVNDFQVRFQNSSSLLILRLI